MEFIPCEKCDKGYIYSIDKSTATKCDCLKQYQERRSIEIAVEKSNIPLWLSETKVLIDYSLDDYVGQDFNNNLFKIKKFINNFDRYSKRNLFISGKPGTQKSTIARYMGMELLKQGKTVYYSLADTLIRDLIRADRDDELKNKMDEIIQYDCLIIDELSQDKITTYKSGWQNTFLLPFLKKRIELIRKSVVFISNSPIENIGEYFKGAIQDIVYREVADKEMIFEDEYDIEINRFDPKTLWDD